MSNWILNELKTKKLLIYILNVIIGKQSITSVLLLSIKIKIMYFLFDGMRLYFIFKRSP